MSTTEAARPRLRANRAARLGWCGMLPFLLGSLGCWEQVSPNWFPLMKRQAALQAFELNEYYGKGEGLT
ncbi:MAG: hypothetical protein VCB42_06685, partial [Myxococcota bacterium]